MSQPALEKSFAISPLLAEPVIERDYTRGIDSQLASSKLGASQGSEKVIDNPPPPPPSDPSPPTPGATTEGGPAGFSFNEEIEDKSDVTGEEEPGFNLASGSAKTFANVIGDIIKVKVPEISYQFVRIDLNNIETHIINGNINENLRDVFRQINTGTRESLEFSEDEIRMWKKAFKEYLEYKNIAVANPETAFWIATGVLATTQVIKIRELGKANKGYIVDAINSYNPGYFDSFRVKKDMGPEKKDKDPENKETGKDKKTDKQSL